MEKSSSHNWDWFSVALLFLLLQVTAGRLIIADWAPFLYFAETFTALGTILGMALGTSRFNRRMIALLAIDYTIMVIPWQWTVIAQSEISSNVSGRFLITASRLSIAFTQFVQRAPVNDPFLFVAFVSLAMWIISLAAGYWLIRHDNLPAAVIPSAVVMIIIQIYDNYFPFRSWWLAIYLFLALLLIGRRYFLRSRIQWKAQHVAISEDAWPEILNSLIVVTVVSVFAAWFLPTSLSSLQVASDAWNKVSNPIRNRFSNAVVALQSSHNNGGTNYYSDNLTLGINAAQGNQPIFTVMVLSSPLPMTYYWRGQVYGFYTNGQWSNIGISSLDFQPANGNLNIINFQKRGEAQFQFTMQLPRQSLLYAPSEPIWMDQSGSVSFTLDDHKQADPLAWFANPAIAQGGRYQVRAEIADPSVAELEAAGTNYPAWVQGRYLEVPQDIRTMFQTLADQVTTGKSTPYEKAEAITNYLRETIQYSTTVSPAPPGQDPAVWVLFDTKKGFCNYYASDEVLLLRSIGIPARMAVGFAEGEGSNNDSARSETFTVRNHDAHAWPEVYFPNIGWVEFEPTASQNPIVRPATQQPIATPEADQTAGGANTPKENTPSGSGTSNKPLMNTLLTNLLWIALTLIVIAALILSLRRTRLLDQAPVGLSKAFERFGAQTPAWINNWMIWNQLTPIERSFASVNVSLRWLGIPQPVSATAAERAAELAKRLPSASAYIEIVASEHQSALFSARPADPARARRAGLMILLHTLRFTFRKFSGRETGQ
jgi:transglutaminase-like putative cysteine protease